MTEFSFLFLDLFQASPEWEDDRKTWVIGPANYSGSDESRRSSLNRFVTRDQNLPVQCRAPRVVDQFLSILDSRRLRRSWQNSDFVATTLSVDELQRTKSQGWAVFASHVFTSYDFTGSIEWNSNASILRQVDVSKIWWRPDKSITEDSQFLIDVPGIPLYVKFGAHGRFWDGVLTIECSNTRIGWGLIVDPGMSEFEEKIENLAVWHRDCPIGRIREIRSVSKLHS